MSEEQLLPSKTRELQLQRDCLFGRESEERAEAMWIDGFGTLPGNLVVVSGPSGCGKSTLIGRALARPELQSMRLSVSATTRPPRAGERDGVNYVFMDREGFLSARDRDEFLEWAEFNDHFYGTPSLPVFETLAAGGHVLLEIEVNGALQVRQKAPTALFVFVDVPHFPILETRLRARGTESDAAIHRRLVRARWERDHAHCYDVRIVNDILDQATDDLVALLVQHGCGG
jgi:guanylate kinase